MGHSSQSLLIICFPGEDTQHKTAALEGLGWTSQSHLVVLRENCNPGFPPVPTPARLSLHLPLAKVPATHPLLCLRPSDALCSGSCQKPGTAWKASSHGLAFTLMVDFLPLELASSHPVYGLLLTAAQGSGNTPCLNPIIVQATHFPQECL